MWYLYLNWLLIVLCTANLFASDAAFLSAPLKKLDQHIQAQIQNGKAVGCAVAVVYQGKIIFIKAYGVKKKGEKALIDLNTVFQLGSVSKPISASLIALLQKQHLLSVKNAVTEYYPHVLPTTTIRHLLSHTSGYNRAGWNYKIEAGWTRSKLLLDLSKSEQKVPGETFDYHNLAYSLIEEVIAKICQQPFKEAIKERLLYPLKMMNTSVGYDDFKLQSNRAWTHQEIKGRWKPSKQFSYRYHNTACASAGINSNIKDMAIFLQLQMGGMTEILTSQDLADFHNPITAAPDALRWFQGQTSCDVRSYYGQGWRIVDYHNGHLVFHGGWIKGVGNFLGFLPAHNVGIVILHNAEGGFAFKTAMMFFDQCVKKEKN